VSGVTPVLLAALERHATTVTAIGAGRYSCELPVDPPPARWLTEIARGGATLVSLNPLRDTLEDLFVQKVTHRDVVTRDRGLGVPGEGVGA